MLGINYLYAPWGLTIGARTQMVADQDPFPGFGGPAPGYTIFDLYATVKPVAILLPDLPKSWLQDWQVNLGVDNLLDRLYRRPLSSIPGRYQSQDTGVVLREPSLTRDSLLLLLPPCGSHVREADPRRPLFFSAYLTKQHVQCHG